MLAPTLAGDWDDHWDDHCAIAIKQKKHMHQQNPATFWTKHRFYGFSVLFMACA